MQTWSFIAAEYLGSCTVFNKRLKANIYLCISKEAALHYFRNFKRYKLHARHYWSVIFFKTLASLWCKSFHLRTHYFSYNKLVGCACEYRNGSRSSILRAEIIWPLCGTGSYVLSWQWCQRLAGYLSRLTLYTLRACADTEVPASLTNESSRVSALRFQKKIYIITCK